MEHSKTGNKVCIDPKTFQKIFIEVIITRTFEFSLQY